MLTIKHRHDDHSRLSSPIINCIYMNTFSGNLFFDVWDNLPFKKEAIFCCFLEYPNTRLAHTHDIDFDAKYCILEHFLEVGKANHSPLLFHRSRHPPSIIAQKLRTVTAAHRFEVINLLKNITQVWNTVRPVLKRTCLTPHQ